MLRSRLPVMILFEGAILLAGYDGSAGGSAPKRICQRIKHAIAARSDGNADRVVAPVGCEYDDGRGRCGAAVEPGKRCCETHAPLASAVRRRSRKRSR
jgi:hypothetical protein